MRLDEEYVSLLIREEAIEEPLLEEEIEEDEDPRLEKFLTDSKSDFCSCIIFLSSVERSSRKIRVIS